MRSPFAPRSPLALALALALAVVGCVTPTVEVEPAASVTDLAPVADSLWPDHQNEPHPAFGWPTLTHPAGATPMASPWWGPIPAATMPASVKGIAHAAQVEGVESGAGTALFGSLAYVPTSGRGSASIVDISDPLAPAVISTVEGSGGRGAAFIAYPDGRLVVVSSTGAGFDVVDVTDPKMPEIVAQAKPARGGHKVGVVPGTPIVYNANSAGGGATQIGLEPSGNLLPLASGQTEIYDLTDPAKPVLVQEFKNGYGCHHIYFWITPEKQRATCAGIEYTQIWDIADPLDPKVIVNIPVHYGVADGPSTSIPIVAFSHFAILNEKGNVLIVGDEMGGGSVPPGCTVPGAPTGALWFYDVSNEKSPLLKGWFSPGTQLPSNPGPSCTAHHGRLVPDPEGKRELLAMAFYGAGVVLVDFTDPMMPKLVDQWNDATNTWEVWYYNGYLFTGDMNRGLDVLTFE